MSAAIDPRSQLWLTLLFLSVRSDSPVVSRGVAHIIKATLVVWVNFKAVFSVRKYNVPPVSPAANIVSSSLMLSEKILRGEMNHIPIYAIMKRRRNIS